MMRTLRSGALIAATLVAGLAAAGCDADPIAKPRDPGTPVGAPDVQLVAFDSCPAALRELQDAAIEQVGPYGLPGDPSVAVEDGAVPLGRDGAATAEAPAKAPTPQHSTTNVHEANADEPDLVKTDGTRIVSAVHDGKLRVIDVASREVTATIDLGDTFPSGLFLHGDRALVISPGGDMAVPQYRGNEVAGPMREQLTLLQVDLTGDGEIVDKMTVEGGYVDARSTDGVARVVVRSSPHLEFTHPASVHSEGAATQHNRSVIRSSEIGDWLPRYTLDSQGNRPPRPLVDCSRISHPKPTTGTSLLTVLTLDLDDKLGTGDPVSITANAGTVYGNGENLYVADDNSMRFIPMPENTRMTPRAPEEPKTRVYQFDVSGDGPPEFVASGAVEGTLLNQYSMSEHEGHLRIATTTHDWNSRGPADEPASESSVMVLKQVGEKLTQVGAVGGLGKGERIYSVRFLGDLGYVVTFRETDPLYRIDLSDPSDPQVDGELKITGFSSYLHPVGDGRLLGLGQEATNQGRTTGTQVSLFDITAAKPARLDQLHVPGAGSSAEHDPHAFLYWPEDDLVVIPMHSYKTEYRPASALVLKLTGDRVERVGSIRHSAVGADPYGSDINRSLVIGDTLWTLSANGVQANDLVDLDKKAFVDFK